MVKHLALASVLLLASYASPLLAQPAPLDPFQGTKQEQDACRPNVTKFCKEFIPDTFRILACLQAHRPRLSRACRFVLESHGQ
jgi:hypothetical protein